MKVERAVQHDVKNATVAPIPEGLKRHRLALGEQVKEALYLVEIRAGFCAASCRYGAQISPLPALGLDPAAVLNVDYVCGVIATPAAQSAKRYSLRARTVCLEKLGGHA